MRLGPTLETLDFYYIRIGSTPATFSYFDLYLYSAHAAHYVYLYKAVLLAGCPVIIEELYKMRLILSAAYFLP